MGSEMCIRDSAGAAPPAAAGAAAAIGVTPHFSSNCFESSAASATVKLDKSSIILFRSGIFFYSLGCVSEFSADKLLIFSECASKILINFEAGAFKIPTILALASSSVGKLATFWTPA